MFRKDYFIGALVGVLTGAIWTPVLQYLRVLDFLGNFAWALVVIVPIVFVFGLWFGRLLARWRPFFVPFSRFIAIGFLNGGIDFGVFNLLIYLTGIEIGFEIAWFKAAAFVVAVTNSYFWNHYWAFESKTRNKGSEFFQYLIVTLLGAGLNVGVTTLIINFVAPPIGFTQIGWDNVAAVIATVLNLIWNFMGYKLIVFRKSQPIV